MTVESDLTKRDRVWAAALDLASQRRFTTADVREHPRVAAVGVGTRTIKATLYSVVAAGYLVHRDGEHYYYPPTDAVPHTRLRNRPPRRWTFADPAVREWVESRLEGRTLNLFAGETHLDHPSDGEIIRNDMDPERPADHHIDAIEVDEYFDAESFDTVILDPPWGEGIVHSRPIYNGHVVDGWTRVRDGVAHVLRPGGRVIRIGYDTSGLSAKHASRVEATCSIHFIGRQRDAGGVVERLAWTAAETGGQTKSERETASEND